MTHTDPPGEHSPSAAGSNGPLADLRVIAVEQYAAGPFASLQLAALGADVIKVEDPGSGGDVGRGVPPDAAGGDSLFFQTFNHGKRSVSLDLRNDAGRALLLRLVEHADAVVSNLRGDVPAKLRIRYEDLAEANPRIVCCSLSAYGMTGPRAAEPGYDYLIQALTGWMNLTGEPGGAPTKTGISLVDFASAYATAASVLAGVHAARRTGQGMDCDLSLYDVGMNLLTYLATWYLTAGYATERTHHSAHPTLVPFQNFETADGWMVVACAKEVFWSRLVATLDLDEFREPRYATFSQRLENRDELLGQLVAVFRGRSTDDWVEVLTAGGVPCAPINDLASAMTEPQAHARDLFQSFGHPTYGDVTVLRSPMRVGEFRRPTQVAPKLGQHTEDVLSEMLEIDAAEFAELRDAGAFLIRRGGHTETHSTPRCRATTPTLGARSPGDAELWWLTPASAQRDHACSTGPEWNRNAPFAVPVSGNRRSVSSPGATTYRKPPRASGCGVNPTSVAGPGAGSNAAQTPQRGSWPQNHRLRTSRGRPPGASHARSCSPEFAITTSPVR
jgi:crotonobetainyl-CoA:carnitine CoA-transferase CaiB-like acyl-CoA transferase